MAPTTLLVGALFAFVAAGVFGLVGRRMLSRDVGGDAQLAVRLFATWWLALSGSTFLGGAQSTAAAFGFAPLDLWIVVSNLNLVLICVALWGLLYYLVFLYTGKRGILWPLTAFYVGYYVLLQYYVTVSDPAGVRVGRWSTSIQYASPVGGPLFAVVLVLLVLPQILGALAYFLTFFRVKDPTSRWRVAIVSWAIIVWFGSALAAAASGLSQNDAWQLASRFIGLAAAGAIFAAYVPPAWARRKWGVEPLAGRA